MYDEVIEIDENVLVDENEDMENEEDEIEGEVNEELYVCYQKTNEFDFSFSIACVKLNRLLL